MKSMKVITYIYNSNNILKLEYSRPYSYRH